MARNASINFLAPLGDIAISPSDVGYDARRSVWNATIDRHPALICLCETPADVQRAIAHATREGRKVCIRGGGHNIAGTAVADGAVMLDLSEMKRVAVDATAARIRVGGGATFAEVDAATQAHGLVLPGGVVSSTGVGGLTLGGGIGWLARRHGLTIDSLLSMEVVLADGTCRRVSEGEHPDLFWALRGGGGNFGVVTEFEFQTYSLGPHVSFGPTFFALEDAATVLTAYARHSAHLTRDACVWANLMTAPPVPVLPEKWHGQKVLTLMQFHASASEKAQRDLTPLYGGAVPLGSAFAPRAYTEAQSFLDDAYAFGARNYWRSHNHLTLTDALIADLVDLAYELPTPASELLICQLGGAVADVDAEATAFAHRHVPFISTPSVRWDNAEDDAEMIRWLKGASQRIATHAVPGAYVNFIAEMGGADAAYQHHLGRLGEIKHQYDPSNLFCVNQNVAPAPPEGAG